MTSRFSDYRWFPWAIAGAMSLVVGVNIALTYFAISSAPRLVTQHPFDEGNGYNAILDAARHADNLGWNAQLGFARSRNASGELTVSMTDRAGQPLRGLSVTVHIDRPVGATPELVLPLSETAPGRYSAAADLGLRGQWEIRLVARQGETLFEQSQRLVIE